MKGTHLQLSGRLMKKSLFLFLMFALTTFCGLAVQTANAQNVVLKLDINNRNVAAETEPEPILHS